MPASNKQKIIDGCDQCVLCGLCLPHCPTYQLEQNECESPRGRIVLIQALMRGEIDSRSSDLSSLDHCLICRSCEAVCPSRVPYGELITLTREWLRPKQSLLVEQLMEAIAEPKQMQKALTKLKLYKKSGMQWLVSGIGLLKGEFKAAEGLLKFFSPAELNRYYPARSEIKSDLTLFTGCMGASFDQQTVRDAIAIINSCGSGVRIDQSGGCCGAMHRHNGDVNSGERLKGSTLKSLASSGADIVVGIASSCVARINEGGNSDTPPVMVELTDFLVANIDKLPEGLSAMNKKIALHQPCTNKNLLKNFDKTLELLEKIPGLEVMMLPTLGCCGASGIHMVSDAEHSQKFLQDSVKWLRLEKPDLIVSQNMGCMFHLVSEMERQNMPLEVVHPVSLMRRALPYPL